MSLKASSPLKTVGYAGDAVEKGMDTQGYTFLLSKLASPSDGHSTSSLLAEASADGGTSPFVPLTEAPAAFQHRQLLMQC